MFPVALLEEISDWFAFLERNKILGCLNNMLLFNIGIYCCTVPVGYNYYIALINLKT